MVVVSAGHKVITPFERIGAPEWREVIEVNLTGAFLETYLQANNAEPRPFIWTASAEAILAKVRRGRVALAQIPN